MNNVWEQTYTGQKFTLPEVDPDAINIEDIAHSLSLQCRFGGHVKKFYSVAEHSVLVSRMVPRDLAITGLFHDASEAYLTDVTSPVKVLLPEFKELEKIIEKALADCLGFKYPFPPVIKYTDLRMLATEKYQLMGDSPDRWICDDLEPYRITLKCLDPVAAKVAFYERLHEIIPHRMWLNCEK